MAKYLKPWEQQSEHVHIRYDFYKTAYCRVYYTSSTRHFKYHTDVLEKSFNNLKDAQKSNDEYIVSKFANLGIEIRFLNHKQYNLL